MNARVWSPNRNQTNDDKVDLIENDFQRLRFFFPLGRESAHMHHQHSFNALRSTYFPLKILPERAEQEPKRELHYEVKTIRECLGVDADEAVCVRVSLGIQTEKTSSDED